MCGSTASGGAFMTHEGCGAPITEAERRPFTRTLRKGLKEFMEAARTATWRSGYAEVCKTFYPGSIPGVASTSKINDLGTACGAVSGRLAFF
jgi:hypothetical protein